MALSRRTTLGSVSQSAVNSRAGRASLGPARISNSAGGDGIVKPPRMSLSAASSSSVPALSSRPSIGVSNNNSAVGASRRSSVGVARKSSLQATGRQSMATSTRVTDPRNISDKQFMNASIRGLIDYLTQHNFDHAISSKILTRPAVKDFNNIIMFLFKQLDPNYVSTGKFEEEVVSVFKLLGYPCQISKANIAAVGSPHAWPSLLASIMWLIELLAYDEEADIGSINEADNDDIGFEDNATLTDKSFYPYLSKAYTLFLSGDDDKYSELEEQFVSRYEDKNVLIRDQIAALEQRNVSLTREIEEVEGRRAYLPELESKRTAYQSDLGKFRLLIEQLQKHKDQLEAKTTSREIELEKVNSAVELVQNEISNLRERIAGQEISPEDVKRMISEREKLEDAQQQASEARQILQRKVWESEMALRDQVQALEDTSKAYTSIAEDLKLVPHTARNARGKHLNIEIDIRAKKRDGLLKSEVKREIIPSLIELTNELSETTAKLRPELMSEQDMSEELDLKATELQEITASTEVKLRRAEEAYRREKDSFDQAAELHSTEMDAMETRLDRLRDLASEESRTIGATRRVTEAKATRNTRRSEHQRKKRELMEAIMDVVAQCASHREIVQQKLTDVKEAYSQKLEGLLLGQVIGSTNNVAVSAIKYNNYINKEFNLQSGIKSNNIFSQEVYSPDEFADDADTEVIEDEGRGDMFPLDNSSKFVTESANMSPIDSNEQNRNRSDTNGSRECSIDVEDIEDQEVALNLSRIAPEPTSRQMVFNLNGLIEACAKDDENLLDDSLSLCGSYQP